MKENICPYCENDRVVPGRYFNPKAFIELQARSPRFIPDGLKKFTLFDPGIAIIGGEEFLACLDCGLLWSHVDHKKLTHSVKKNGRDETIQACGLGDNSEEST